MPVVLKVSPKILRQMTTVYGSAKHLPAGAVFLGHRHQATITGYHTGKVLFQGKGAEAEAKRWSAQLEGQPSTGQSSGPHRSPGHDLPAGFSRWSVIGSDEVGVGSYFGPLTVAAVYVQSNQVDSITKLGIQDSKKLTDPQIIKMSHQVIERCPYHIVNLDPPIYNQLMSKYHNQQQVKALAHNLALAKLLTKLSPARPQAILIDQFVAPRTYFNYLKGQSTVIRDQVFFHVRGESEHVAVAAGSIVARYYSLKRMDALSEKAGVTLPIGAGTNVDNVAAHLIRHGQDLRQFAKVHFANTAKARQLASR